MDSSDYRRQIPTPPGEAGKAKLGVHTPDVTWGVSTHVLVAGESRAGLPRAGGWQGTNI